MADPLAPDASAATNGRTNGGSHGEPHGDDASASARAVSLRLVQQLEQTIGRTSQPMTRVPLLLRLAEVHERRLGDPTRALDVLLRALVIQPNERRLLREVARLADLTGEHQRALHALDDIVETATDAALRVVLNLQRAALNQARSGRSPETLRCYEAVLADEPDHLEALTEAVAIYRDLGQVASLADALGHLSLLLPDAEARGTTLRELGALCRAPLGRPADAIAAFEAARSILGDDVPTLRALQELYHEHGRVDAEVEVLERLAVVDPDHPVAWRTAALHLAVGVLRDEARALRLATALLQQDPTNEQALNLLEDHHRKTNNTAGLRSVLERRLEFAHAPAERARLYRELAHMHATVFSDTLRAATYYRLLLEDNPTDDAALAGLSYIYQMAGHGAELAATLLRRVEICDDPLEAADLLLELALVRRDALDDPEGAIQALLMVRERDPAHPAALAMLDTLLRATGDFARLIPVLQARLELLPDPLGRASLRIELADVMREEGDVSGAARELAAALREAPGVRAATDRLAALLEDEGRDDELVQVLKDGIAASAAAGADVAVWDRLARAEARRGNPAGQRTALEQVIALAPDRNDARETLADLAERDGRLQDAWSLLQQVVDSHRGDTTVPATDQARWYRKIAWVAERRGDTGKAAAALDIADRHLPDHPDTLAALARVHSAASNPQRALDAYDRMLRHPTAPPSPRRTQEIRLAAMDLALRAGDDDNAARKADEVLLRAPSDPGALRTRATLCARRGETTAAVTALHALLAVRERNEAPLAVRMALLTEIARLHLRAPEDLGAARALLERAADLGANASPPPATEWEDALKLLQDVAERQGDRAASGRALEARARLAQIPEKRAALHVEAGQLAAHEPAGHWLAAEHFVRALEVHGERLDALQSAENLLIADGDIEGLALALHRAARAAHQQGAPGLARRLSERLGELLVQHAGDYEGAVAAFRDAAELEPARAETRLRLAELMQAHGDYRGALGELRTLLATTPTNATAWRLIANVFSDLGEPEGAHFARSVLYTARVATPVEIEAVEARSATRAAPDPGATAQPRCTPREWLPALLPAGASPALARVMATLHDALGDTLELPSLRALGFRRGDEVDPDQDLLVLRATRTVAELFGAPPPRLYFDKNFNGLRILPTLPAALACGTDMFRGRREAEVSYLVGAAIAYLQPEFTLTAVFAPASLAALVDAARGLLAPAGSPLTPHAASVRRALERRLSAAERSTLATDLARVGAAEREAWPAAVALAAHRAGLLACDDLVGAARTDTAHLIPHMPVTARDVFKDLSLFCVSDAFLTLRQRLFGARRPAWRRTDADA